MPTLNTHKHYKMTKAQEEILQRIGRGGNSSASSLKKDLHKNYSDVRNSLFILQETGFVKKSGMRKGRGNPEVYFILTDKGVKKLIELKPTFEDFWKLILFVYDKTTNHKSKLKINDVFRDFEKNVLGVSKEYSSPAVEWALQNLRDKKKSDRYNGMYIIGYLLAEKKGMTLDQILANLEIKDYQRDAYISLDNQHPGLIIWLVTRYLITQDSLENQKYHLSPVGLLFVLAHFYERYTQMEEIPLVEEEIKKKISKTIENHHHILPRIFDNWRTLSNIFGEEGLLDVIKTLIHFYDTSYAEPIQNSGLFEIFSNLRMMTKVTLYKLQRELSSGREILDWWVEQKRLQNGIVTKKKRSEWYLGSVEDPGGTHNIPDVFQKLLELGFECFPYKIEREHISDQIIRIFSISTNTHMQQSIQDYISFLFYSIVVYRIRLVFLSGEYLKINSKEGHQQIDEKQTKIIKSWKYFMNKNKDFESWYRRWTSQIVSFGEDNLDFLRRMNNLSFESFSLKTKSDRDFLTRFLPSTYIPHFE